MIQLERELGQFWRMDCHWMLFAVKKNIINDGVGKKISWGWYNWHHRDSSVWFCTQVSWFPRWYHLAPKTSLDIHGQMHIIETGKVEVKGTVESRRNADKSCKNGHMTWTDLVLFWCASLLQASKSEICNNFYLYSKYTSVFHTKTNFTSAIFFNIAVPIPFPILEK